MKPPAAPRTLGELMRFAASRLGASGIVFGHGTSNAWDEAAWLLLWSLRLPLDQLEPNMARVISAEQRERALALIERRCRERLPAAYLTGEAWLYGLPFACDARALVPRSPIAELLQTSTRLPARTAFEALLAQAPPIGQVLDLCTGGASLAIFAALRFKDAQVVGSDLSDDALALAAENVKRHGLGARIELARADLYDGLAARRFELIVCNPPYVNAVSMQRLPREYRAEPRAALAGGRDGMRLIAPILAGACQYLAPGGLLVLEIGHEARHFDAAFAGLAVHWMPVTAGDRMVLAVTREALLAGLPRGAPPR